MKIPPNHTEEQVLALLDNIANRFKMKYRFDIHDEDDIYQEAYVLAWQALDKYNGNHPLENFLTTHVSNRLKNFKRNNLYYKQEPGIDSSKQERAEWNERYLSQKRIFEAITIDRIRDEHESNMRRPSDSENVLYYKQVAQCIDKFLPSELRIEYLKMKEGINIPKPRREYVMGVLKQILEDNGYGP